ncbi:MAG: hypothetical protein DRR19_16460 [Candidatus Parabeggiatoa sp. nov. 1]|nr:MAG: hypothetical protein DRR19_16460 [Gammaproteobacteria bacterium]
MPCQRLPKTTVGLLLSQWVVLIQRNFRIIFADKLNLSLIFLQVPLIAMLIIVAFYNFNRDKQSFDEAARILYYFGIMKEPLEQADKSINIDKLHRYAKTLAQETNIATRLEYINTTIKPFFDRKQVPVPNLTFTYIKKEIQLISDMASVRRGSVYFLLVAACIWFGIMGSCKEIVTEQPILKRESRSYLFIFPYLAAKFLVLTIVLGVQTCLLSIMVVPLLLELSWMDALWIGLILWVAAFVSASLGLFISSVVTSYRVALTLVPLLMIPQLLFGGLLRPQVDLENSVWSHLTNALSAVTIQRWAFESILTTDAYADGGILKLQVNPKGNNELELVQAKNTSLVSSFFRPRQWGNFEVGHLWPPLLYLLGASLVFFIGGYFALRWRFT